MYKFIWFSRKSNPKDEAAEEIQGGKLNFQVSTNGAPLPMLTFKSMHVMEEEKNKAKKERSNDVRYRE